MVQTHTKKRLLKLLCIPILSLLPVTSLLAQEVSVRLENIDVSGDSIRGKKPSFPYPVITRQISVTTNGDMPSPVQDLGDTSRWLKPDEIAKNGLTIRESWPVLSEALGGTQFDLYSQSRRPEIREVTRLSRPILPSSTVLVMDISNSIEDCQLDSAKQGAFKFIENLRIGPDFGPEEQDRVAIIEFGGTRFRMLTNFSSDRAALENAVTDVTSVIPGNGGTPLYFAMLQALFKVQNEDPARVRSVIVYTDGLNNVKRDSLAAKRVRIGAVQAIADSFRIPIHTIYLAQSDTTCTIPVQQKFEDKAAEDTLAQIASQSGGNFFRTATGGANFIRVFDNLSQIIQHLYLLAYEAPEPCAGPTRRTLTVSARDDRTGISGSDALDYSVSFLPRTSDITLAASSSSTRLSSGDTLDVTLTVRNNGPDSSFAVDLLQVLPADTLILVPGSASLPIEEASPGSLKWIIPPLPNNNEVSLTFSLYLNPAVQLADTTSLQLAATVIAVCDDDNQNNNAGFSIRISPTPVYDIEVSKLKIVAVDTVLQGENFGYRLVVTNNGPDPATNLILKDSQTAFDLLSQPFDFTIEPDSIRAGVIYWSIASLAPNDALTFEYNSNAPLCTDFTDPVIQVDNTATIENAPLDSDPSNNSASTTIFIVRQPCVNQDFELTKTVSQTTIRQGDTLNFQIDLRKVVGNGSALISVFDELPRYLKLLDVQPQSQFQNGNVLQWQFDGAQIQDVTSISITASVPCDTLLPAVPLDLTNTAWLVSEVDSNSTNDRDSVRVTVTDSCATPVDFKIDKTALLSDISQGEAFQFQIEIVPMSGAAGAGLAVFDQMPRYVNLLSAEPQPQSQNGNLLEWRFEAAELQDTTLIFITAEVPCDSILPGFPIDLTNLAWLDAPEDSDSTNNRSSVTITVSSRSAACDSTVDFEIRKSATPTDLAQGEELQFQIDVIPLSGSAGSGMTVFDQLPRYLTVLDAQPQPQSQIGNLLEWRFEASDLQDVRSILINAIVPCDSILPGFPVDLTNLTWLDAPEDSDSTNNRSSITVTISSVSSRCAATVDFALSKSIAASDIMQGEEFSFQIDVTPVSGAADSAMMIFDALPGYLSFVDATPQPQFQNGNVLAWQFAASEIQNALSMQVTAVVPCDSLLPGVPLDLTNSAWLTSPEDVNTANDSSSADFTISDSCAADSDFELEKTVDQSQVKEGELFTYSIQVRRLMGPTPTSLRVTDVLPEHVEVLSIFPAATTADGDTLFWQFNDTDILDTLSLSITAWVPCGSPLPGLPLALLNAAWLEVPGDIDSSNDRDEVTVTITEACPAPEYDLFIVKIPNQTQAPKGQPVRYDISVTNDGPDMAAELIVTDTLPADMVASDFSPSDVQVIGNTLTWRFTNLPADATETISYQTVLPNTVIVPGGQVLKTNRVNVSSQFDTNLANNDTSASVIFTDGNLQNCLDFMVLDRNVFKPEEQSPLQVTVDVDNLNDIRLDVFDITGYPIRTLARGVVPTGRNTFFWDGLTEQRQQVGSGIYIILFEDAGRNYQCITRVIVTR